MTNDTPIARVGTDSVQPSLRRRTHSDSIQLGQLSFFDELLSIGQFESALPEPTPLPQHSPTAESATQHRGEPLDRDPNESNEDADRPTDAASTQSTNSIVPPLQTHSFDPNPVAASDDLGPSKSKEVDPSGLRKSKEVDASDNQLKPNALQANEAGVNVTVEAPVDTSQVIPIASKDSVQPASADLFDETLSGEASESRGDLLSQVDEQANVLDRVQNPSASSDSTEDERDTDTPDNAESIKGPRDARGKGKFEISDLTPVDEHSDANDAGQALPRNKRAERLAKQASEKEPSERDSNNASEDSPLLDAISRPGIEDPETPSSSQSGTQSTSSVVPPLAPSISPPIGSFLPVPTVSLPMTGTGAESGSGTRALAEARSTNAPSSMRLDTNTGSSGGAGATQANGPGRSDSYRSEAVRGNSGTQISAYQEAKLVQRVLRGVEQLANGGGQVRLRLHPPELGSLQMSMRMEAGQVFAKLEVENTTARDALLNNVQTLKDRMAEQGMKVAAFEVEVSTDSSGSGISNSNGHNASGHGNESRWENASSRFAQQNRNRLNAEPASPEAISSSRKNGSTWTRTNGSLDLKV